MKSITESAIELGLLEAPKWLSPNVVYETKVGSHSYGVSTDDSDIDISGFCVPPKEIVFPHLYGSIHGFGKQKKSFHMFNDKSFQHESFGPQKYDLSILSIIFLFRECMDCQPNWLEMLYTPENCVITSTSVSDHLREHRDLFLHQGALWRFTGFAKSQLAKMNKKNRDKVRLLKYGYHAVRMVLEGEQVLTEGTLVLDDKIDVLSSVRNGDWSFDEIASFCEQKETELKKIYDTEAAAVPYKPDETKIKTLLLECLEEFYGSLEGCIRFGRWS